MTIPRRSKFKTPASTSIRGFLIGLAVLAASNFANAIEIGARDWRQPIETVGFSYDQVAKVCDVDTGICCGSVQNTGGPVVDLTGWTWASVEEVTAMFRALTDDVNGVFNDTNNRYKNPKGWEWILPAIKDTDNDNDTGLLIETSEPNAGHDAVFGITRSTASFRDGKVGANRAAIRYDPPDQAGAYTNNPIKMDQPRPINGFWLYKGLCQSACRCPLSP